jgi:aminomethyltransferase
MKRTPLYDAHVALQGRLVDFAGWDMPLQYSGVVDEYHAVRRQAGLFDVSHMGRIRVAGIGAVPLLQRVATNDVDALAPLESHYSMVCNPDGGIKDDIFVYRLAQEEFLLCVNASNREKIMQWLLQQASSVPAVDLSDRSGELAQMALQGPASREILSNLGVTDMVSLKPRRCLQTAMGGFPLLLTRTGYTGEIGYELYVPAGHALQVWNELFEAGHKAGLKPAGLGARDLLRLDMGYLLYGNDIDEATTPLEAASDWVVAFRKPDFIGRESLERQRRQAPRRRLVGFELLEKAVPRHGFPLLQNGQDHPTPIGEVTSGNLSPSLQKGIGLGYVPPSFAGVGTRLLVDIRGRQVPAVVVKPPFYRRREA